MTWLISNWKLVVSTALLLIAAASGFFAGKSYVQSQWDSDKLAMMEEASLMADTLAKKIQDLEVKGAKDEKTIRDYRRRNPTGGVHLPPTTCPGDTGPVGGVQRTAGDQPLPNPAQQAFDNYAAGTGDDALEADLTVNDCRIVFEWARSLKK